MRNPALRRLLLLLGALPLLHCAQTTRWKDGDSCTQLSRNREEIQGLEDRRDALRQDVSVEGREARLKEADRLDERIRDLQRNNASLQGSCSPADQGGPREEEWRQERKPDANRFQGYRPQLPWQPPMPF